MELTFQVKQYPDKHLTLTLGWLGNVVVMASDL